MKTFPHAVLNMSAKYDLNPHRLDHHVTWFHQWRPDETLYAEAVEQAAQCMIAGGCLGIPDRPEWKV